MKRFVLTTALGAALLLAASLLPGATVNANHPPTPQPILTCADLDGSGAGVSIGDVGRIVGKYGTSSPDGTTTFNISGQLLYHPLFDLVPTAVSQGISVGDIGAAVSDFGVTCPAADTQIAAATQWVLTSHPALLTENVTTLSGLGYQQAAGDVPGQGVHYINQANWDGIFAPTAPEGLVYNNGELVAQLYYVNGDPATGGVGWGSEPPPLDQVNIDAFCSPVPPNTACSWASPTTGFGDGWHWHENLCRTWIGTIHAELSRKGSAQECQDYQNTHLEWGGTSQWQARVGWMGHLWSHMLNPNQNPNDGNNGRFADCFPDPWGPGPTQHFTGYSCPQ